ncbi:MAG TPA: zinc ribbon domain-containing protein [Terriglobales bacterium]|nr:zinc ribbon domain-containing protein [Terriglobales bacterium]
MPIYEYDCPQCGHFELIRKFSDPPLKKCPTCKKAVKKLMSNTSFQLKGSGWYVTDYAKKSSGGGNSGSSGSGSTAGGGETKSETKSDAKKSNGSKDTSAAAA